MIRVVRVKGPGVKLANKWCYIGDEATVDEQEFEKNKEYVDVIEEIEEPKVQTLEVGAGENQNPEGEQQDGADTNDGTNNEEKNSGEDQNDGNEDEELEALKERAKELGIKNIHNMKKETLIAKIQETEEAGVGENQNPEGE